MEWLVLPQVSQGGKTGFGLLSRIIYIVSFGIVCNFVVVVVGLRVCLGTSIVVVGTIRVFFAFGLSLV